jgi:hypothetical protein
MKKILLSCAILIAFVGISAAQNKIENFPLVQKGDTSVIRGIVSDTDADIPRIRLDNTNLPAVTLPRNVLKKVVDIANRSAQLNEKLSVENQILRERDTIVSRQLNTLTNLRELQTRQLELCEKTNDLLNNSVKSMNDQVTASRELVKEANKNSLAKRTWGIVIGGVGGFALGVILGVIAAK